MSTIMLTLEQFRVLLSITHSKCNLIFFQGKKGENGLPGVDGLAGPPVRTMLFSKQAKCATFMQTADTNDKQLTMNCLCTPHTPWASVSVTSVGESREINLIF